jgi:hypothetical protein
LCGKCVFLIDQQEHRAASAPPILLSLALDRWRFRVLDLDPKRRESIAGLTKGAASLYGRGAMIQGVLSLIGSIPIL